MALGRILRMLEAISEVASIPQQLIRSGVHTIGDKDWTECSAHELRQVVRHLKTRNGDDGFGGYVDGVTIRMYEERAEQIEQGLLPDPTEKT